MKLNKREEFMLWKMIEFQLHRYLLTFVRKQGVERAERHIEISKTIWEVVNMKTSHSGDHRAIMKIHDLIAEKITNDLPKSIDFDMDAEDHDWDILTDKFFRRLILLIAPM